MKKTGIELIVQERKEQIEKHGRTVQLDIERNNYRKMLTVVQVLIEPQQHLQHDYILKQYMPLGWDKEIWMKMCKKPFVDRLVIAGAFIAAQIDVELASSNSD